MHRAGHRGPILRKAPAPTGNGAPPRALLGAVPGREATSRCKTVSLVADAPGPSNATTGPDAAVDQAAVLRLCHDQAQGPGIDRPGTGSPSVFPG
ncbi:MAG: hypothetical protein LBE67_05680 [Kocuria palustris]|nr:hypothetical protein [Kocuria palustris]